MSVRDCVGMTSGPHTLGVNEEAVRRFHRVVGVKGDGVIPTFLTIFRKGEFDLFQRLGIDISELLHGEQVYEIFHPIPVVGDFLYSTKISKAFEKKGKEHSLQFYVMTTQVSLDSIHLANCESTIIVRRQP